MPLTHLPHRGTEQLPSSRPPCTAHAGLWTSLCPAGASQDHTAGWGLSTQAARLRDKHRSYLRSDRRDGFLTSKTLGCGEKPSTSSKAKTPLTRPSSSGRSSEGGLQLPRPPTRTTIPSTARGHSGRRLREACRELYSGRYTAPQRTRSGKRGQTTPPDRPRAGGGWSPARAGPVGRCSPGTPPAIGPHLCEW